MKTENLGSQRFQGALKSSGATLLDEPIKQWSFYCHALIARGGQGSVFLGTGDELAHSRVCVVKTFTDANVDMLSRVERNIRIQLRLLEEAADFPTPMYPRDEQIRPAPWVPDILAWDLDAPEPWVAQDFRGPNLRRGLSNGIADTPRPLDQRTSGDVRNWLLSQIVSAVEFIHMHDVIHRDLKPDNILVERVGANCILSESVALCDFDLSKSQNHTTLTQTGWGMGTPGYSSPEQLLVSARDVTPASDVYSVAMVAVYIFTGCEPEQFMRGPSAMHRWLDPVTAEQLGSKREWIEQALSFMPEDRPPLAALGPRLYGPRAQR